jgi:hypothetical protein
MAKHGEARQCGAKSVLAMQGAAWVADGSTELLRRLPAALLKSGHGQALFDQASYGLFWRGVARLCKERGARAPLNLMT